MAAKHVCPTHRHWWQSTTRCLYLGALAEGRRLRDRGLVEDVTRLRERLFPEGVPQERVFGPSYFLARYGARAFVERILDAGPGRVDL